MSCKPCVCQGCCASLRRRRRRKNSQNYRAGRSCIPSTPSTRRTRPLEHTLLDIDGKQLKCTRDGVWENSVASRARFSRSPRSWALRRPAPRRARHPCRPSRTYQASRQACRQARRQARRHGGAGPQSRGAAHVRCARMIKRAYRSPQTIMLQKINAKSHGEPAAAPRLLETRAVRWLNRAASGRFLKTLGQKNSS